VAVVQQEGQTGEDFIRNLCLHACMIAAMSGGMNTFSVLVIVEKPAPPSPGLMPLRTAPESDCLQPSVLLMGLLDRENLMDPDDPRLFVDTVERGIGTGNMKPVYFPAAP